MKRFFDITVSFLGLLFLSPLILIVILIVFIYDHHNPLYRPIRVGKDFVDFRMTKFRTMVVNADKIGGSSTSTRDPRITPIGHVIRKYKLDEVIQLWDVFRGKTSIVGPRPQVKAHVLECYTQKEKEILQIKPGITDISSIVFSDEGDILKDSTDPDLDYNQLIRPWKSRLALLYKEHNNFYMDLTLIYLTLIALIDKKKALSGINDILMNLPVEIDLIEVCQRKKKLVPTKLFFE